MNSITKFDCNHSELVLSRKRREKDDNEDASELSPAFGRSQFFGFVV